MKIVKTEATRKQNRVKSTPPKEESKNLFLFISVRLPVKEVLLKSLWKKSRGKIKSLTTEQAAAKMWQKTGEKMKVSTEFGENEKKNTPKFSEEIVLFVAKTTRQTSRSVEEPLFDTVKLRFEDLFFFLFFLAEQTLLFAIAQANRKQLKDKVVNEVSVSGRIKR